MDKPLLALPYRGPSHSIEVLERLAQRETLRLGLPWTDLTLRQKNGLLDWATRLLDETLRHLWREPLTGEIGLIPGGAVRTLPELGGVEGWLRNRHLACLESARYLGNFRDALEGRDR